MPQSDPSSDPLDTWLRHQARNQEPPAPPYDEWERIQATILADAKLAKRTQPRRRTAAWSWGWLAAAMLLDAALVSFVVTKEHALPAQLDEAFGDFADGN